jgi:hypothetical protein
MIATEIQRRGPSPPVAPPQSSSDAMASAVSAAIKLRTLSPDAMKELLLSLSHSAFSSSPGMSPNHSAPNSSLPSPLVTAAPSVSSAGALPMLSSSAALLEHYNRVARSRAYVRSVMELERSVSMAASSTGRRASPIKTKPLKAKFSLLDRRPASALSRDSWKKAPLSQPAGLKPLRLPPALPRVAPGQQLLGMKAPPSADAAGKEGEKKE